MLPLGTFTVFGSTVSPRVRAAMDVVNRFKQQVLPRIGRSMPGAHLLQLFVDDKRMMGTVGNKFWDAAARSPDGERVRLLCRQGTMPSKAERYILFSKLQVRATYLLESPHAVSEGRLKVAQGTHVVAEIVRMSVTEAMFQNPWGVDVDEDGRMLPASPITIAQEFLSTYEGRFLLSVEGEWYNTSDELAAQLDYQCLLISSPLHELGQDDRT